MSPFFLIFVLFVPLHTTSTHHLCDKRTTCLYLYACYDESIVGGNPLRMLPQAYPSMKIDQVVAWKHNFDDFSKGFSFISILSIVSHDASSVDVSFDTDLKQAGFTFKSSDNSSLMTFNDSKFSYICGKDEMSTMESSSPVESLGRVVHRVRITNPDKKPLGGLINSNLTIELGGKPVYTYLNDLTLDGHRQEHVNLFWASVKENLACDRDIIHDSCHDRDDCEKILIGPHSLRCSHASILALNVSNEWSIVSSVSCHNGSWTLKKDNESELYVPSQDIDLRCVKLPPNVTVAPSPDEETEEIEIETDTTPSIDESEESPSFNGTDIAPNPNPNPLIAVTDASANTKDKDERLSLPGSKWIWIGCGAALLTLITVGNISVCFYCHRNKNDTARKQSKVAKASKKKGGKAQTDSASSGKQSSTERGSNPAKPLKYDFEKPTISSEQPTEMLLDRLKTERIN